MSTFVEVSDVVAHLSRRQLPFAWYAIWPDGHAIQIEVAPRDCVVAIEFFADRRLALSDGTIVPVHVEPRRGESWGSLPAEGAPGPDETFEFQRLVGLYVNDAAARANAAGWIVRAHEREAAVTADYNPGRLNLRYGDDRLVESVDRG